MATIRTQSPHIKEAVVENDSRRHYVSLSGRDLDQPFSMAAGIDPNDLSLVRFDCVEMSICFDCVRIVFYRDIAIIV